MNSKIYLLGIVAALAWKSKAVPKNSEELKVHTCLAAAFEAQSDYRQRHGDYASDLAQLQTTLSLERGTGIYCQGLALAVSAPERGRFRVTAQSGVVRGTADDSQVIALN